ncbi:MAG: septum formation inhibitor Maf [Flavobacteriales bacterium]
MKSYIKHILLISGLVIIPTTVISQVSGKFDKYWNQGKAEITSYQLSQARYGEMREGKSVLVYVTEPFSPKLQVKKNNANSENSVPVLKMNSVKKFTTGLYPYSIMNSVFHTLDKQQNVLKISSSIQDWCGHVYTQLNRREQYEYTSHSYFEEEGGDTFKTLETTNELEDEIWTQIRIDYKKLPIGDFQMIPSLEYTRYLVTELKAHKALAQLVENEQKMVYKLFYPKLKRSLEITFEKQFPYQILEWKETYKSGFDDNAKVLTTTGKKIKTLKVDYWNKHHNKDAYLRKQLGL